MKKIVKNMIACNVINDILSEKLFDLFVHRDAAILFVASIPELNMTESEVKEIMREFLTDKSELWEVQKKDKAWENVRRDIVASFENKRP